MNDDDLEFDEGEDDLEYDEAVAGSTHGPSFAEGMRFDDD